MIRGSLAAVLAVALAACASPANVPQLRDDQFLPYREVSTPVVQGVGSTERTSMGLIGRRDRASRAVSTHALVGVSYFAREGRRYEQARSSQAEALPMRRIKHDGAACRRKEGCHHVEVFLVDVPEPELRKAQAARTGYPIKLFTRAGQATLFPLTSEQVATLFSLLEATADAAVAAR